MTRTQTQQARHSAVLRAAPSESPGRNRRVRVVGVVVLVLSVLSACDTPDPEIHQLVALGWGSPVRPTFCDIAYGPDADAHQVRMSCVVAPRSSTSTASGRAATAGPCCTSTVADM